MKMKWLVLVEKIRLMFYSLGKSVLMKITIIEITDN